MSVRIWLQKDGEAEVVRLTQTGVLGNLKVHEHQPTGKKYIKLGVSLTDPTEEVPQIPQAIVERVTFKGLISVRAWMPYGTYHSADTTTYMLVSSKGCSSDEIAITSRCLTAMQEMLYRVLLSRGRSMHEPNLATLLSHDVERDRDKEHGKGCFAPIPGFPAK